MSNGLGSSQNPTFSTGGTINLYDNLPVKRISVIPTQTSLILTENYDSGVIVSIPTMTQNLTITLPSVTNSTGQQFTISISSNLNEVNTVILSCRGAETALCGQLQNRLSVVNAASIDFTPFALAGSFIRVFSDGMKWIVSGSIIRDPVSTIVGGYPLTLGLNDHNQAYDLALVLANSVINLPANPVEGLRYNFTVGTSPLLFSVTITPLGGNTIYGTFLEKENGATTKAEIVHLNNAATVRFTADSIRGDNISLVYQGGSWYVSGVTAVHDGIV